MDLAAAENCGSVFLAAGSCDHRGARRPRAHSMDLRSAVGPGLFGWAGGSREAAPVSSMEEQLLRLQRMERKLVAGLFDHPGVVSRRDEHRLRYALALAALDTFQPGAASKGGRTRRPDVRVGQNRQDPSTNHLVIIRDKYFNAHYKA